jgi:hypothetical protein
MKALSSRVTRLERRTAKRSGVVILDLDELGQAGLEAEIKRYEGTGTTIIIDDIPRSGNEAGNDS